MQDVALLGAGLDADREADRHAARPAPDVAWRHKRGDSLGFALSEREERNSEAAGISTRYLDEDLEAASVLGERHTEHERGVRRDVEVCADPQTREAHVDHLPDPHEPVGRLEDDRPRGPHPRKPATILPTDHGGPPPRIIVLIRGRRRVVLP